MARKFKLIGFQGSAEDLKSLFLANGLDVQLEEDDWISVSQTFRKVYAAQDYLDAAQHYLNLNPPDLMQAGEKLWGCVSYVVQKFYSQMNVCIKSHRATRALCLYAIDFHPQTSVGRKLTTAYYNGEESHKNFYRPEYIKSELEKFKSNILFFATEFPKINYKQVENSLLPYIEGKMATTDDLEGIVFNKCKVKEEIGSDTYQANYQAK